MSEQKQNGKKRKRFLRVLRRVLLGLGMALALIVALLLSLPLLLSSDWARNQVAQQLATATRLPASLDALSFSWSDGLRLSGLRIGSGELPDPTFLARLGSLHLNFSLLSALRSDLRAEVALSGLRLRLPPPAEADTPPAKPLPDLLREGFAALRQALDDKPLHTDVHLRVALDDMALRLEPAPGGKALELHKLFLHLDVQGLKTSPLTLSSGFELKSEGVVLAPLHFEAQVDGFANPTGQVVPSRARLTARLTAPGIACTADGSLANTLTLGMRAALREAAAPVQRLSPGALPELDGTAELRLALAHAGPDRLSLGLGLDLDGLRATRGPLGDKSLGPLSLALRQDVNLDLKAETAHLPGELKLQQSSRVQWQGGLSGLAQAKPRLNLELAPVHLALGELLPALPAFLPPGLSLDAARLDADRISLTALLPVRPEFKPDLEASLAGLEIAFKGITRRDAAGTVRLADASLRLDSAMASLPGNALGDTQSAAPGSVSADLSVKAEGLSLVGTSPVTLRELAVPSLQLRAEDLRSDAAALFGVSGRASLEQKIELRDLEAKGKAQLPQLRQDARLLVTLPAAKQVVVALEALNITSPLLRVLQPGRKAVETPLSLRASAPDIRLSGPAPLTPSMEGLNLSLDLGEALRCVATSALSGPGGKTVRSDGSLKIDARKLLALAAPFVPAKAKAAGDLSLDWRLAATLPPASSAASPAGAAKPQKPVAQQPASKKLSQSLKELALVQEFEAVLRVDGLDLDWPLPAESLHLRGFSTPRPLRLSTRDGVRESILSGSLAFGPLDALPGLGRLAKPLRGLVTVNAAQQGARSVQFAQVLRLDGMDLDQNLSLSADKLDLVLDREADRLAAILELVDANLSFSLATGLHALPAQAVGKGVSGKGRMEVGTEVRLSGGRSLALAARLLSPGLDLRLGPELTVSGLTSSLRFNRRYSLSQGLRCPGAADELALQPLSEQVFVLSPNQPATGTNTAGEALGQLLRSDAPGAASGAFGLAQLSFKAAGLPLDIRDVQLRLDTDGPVPGLRSFRAGLLGGDVLGSAMIRKTAGRYALHADMAFTGIDPGRLLPGKAPKDLGSQAETSGRLTLEAPLTADPEVLLQRLNFRADITKIGPRTLERMLYALDPDEQNETIVQQRRLMGIGFPRHLRVAAAYGNLSLSGAVDVKGFQLDLPPVDRLGLANLPLRKQLTKPLAAIPAVLKALDAASGTQICRDPADPTGALRVVQPTSLQGATP